MEIKDETKTKDLSLEEIEREAVEELRPHMVVNDSPVDLVLTRKRIKLIETVLGKGLFATMSSTGGALPLTVIDACFAYGLKFVDGGFLSPKQGEIFIDTLIDDIGVPYDTLCVYILAILKRDAGFLFQGD